MTFAEAIPYAILQDKRIKCSLWVDNEGEFNIYLKWDGDRFAYAKHFVSVKSLELMPGFPPAFTELHPQTRYNLTSEEISADWSVLDDIR